MPESNHVWSYSEKVTFPSTHNFVIYHIFYLFLIWFLLFLSLFKSALLKIVLVENKDYLIQYHADDLATQRTRGPSQ